MGNGLYGRVLANYADRTVQWASDAYEAAGMPWLQLPSGGLVETPSVV